MGEEGKWKASWKKSRRGSSTGGDESFTCSFLFRRGGAGAVERTTSIGSMEPPAMATAGHKVAFWHDSGNGQRDPPQEEDVIYIYIYI